MTISKRMGASVVGVLISGGAALAADGVWTNTVGGLWDDAANWQGGVVAGGTASATAWLTNDTPGTIFVKLPPEGVTIGKVVGTGNKVFRGGPVLFGSGTSTLSSAGYYMSDIQGSNGLVLDGGIGIKTGTSYTGPTYLKSANTTVYMNHAATSTNAVDGDLLSTNALVFQGGSILFEGRPNTVSRTLAWTLTEGETLITRATDVGNSVPGTLVTGTGIPAGTYLKNIFSGTAYELSQPATLSGSQTLTFSAIPSVETVQHFSRIEMQVSGTLSINKQTMPVSVRAGELTGGAGVTLSKQGTGTLVLEKISAFAGTLGMTAGTLMLPAEVGTFTGRVSLAGGTLTFLDGGGAATNRLPSVTVSGQVEIAIPVAGAVVVIDRLYGSGELIKTGPGTLQVKWSDGLGKLSVQSGRLRYEQDPDNAVTSLLSRVWFHVDADAAESLAQEPAVDGTNYVTAWSDVRTNGLSAAAATGYAKPFVVAAGQNGRAVVDFGSLKTDKLNGTGGFLEWNVPSVQIRETFVVFSDTPDATNMFNFFLGDRDYYDFHRGDMGQVLHESYASSYLRSGSIFVDMVQMATPTLTKLPSGFHVVSLGASGAVRASTFGRDRFARLGGIRLGEVLVYTNALSDIQRGEVNRYLCQKWLNREVPLFGTIRLGSGAILSLEDGVNLTVGTLTLDGAFVKEGTGTLTAGSLSGDAVTVAAFNGEWMSIGNGLYVRQGGTLNAESMVATNASVLVDTAQPVRVGWLQTAGVTKSGGGTMEVGVLSRDVRRISVTNGTLRFSGSGGCGSWFHVDACVTQSLVTALQNGTNFISRWYDARTNGVDAGSTALDRRPSLQTNGVNGLPYVDFRQYSINDGNGVAPFLDWNTACTNLRTAFIVFSDSPGETMSFILGDINNYHFHRELSGTGKLFDTSHAHANLRNGVIRVDQAAASATTVLTPGFHVITLAPTGPVTAGTFARDRTGRKGGQRLGEVLVYDEPLPVSVRETVTAQLLGKWKGIYTPRVLESVSVAGGGSIRCPYDALVVDALEGEGVIEAARVQVSAVSIGGPANGIGTLAVTGDLVLTNGATVAVDCDGVSCDRLDVSGTLTLGGGGVVQLTCGAQNLNGKTFTLFTFGAVANPENLAAWQVTGEICKRYVVTLSIESGSIRMTFKGKGSVLFLN